MNVLALCDTIIRGKDFRLAKRLEASMKTSSSYLEPFLDEQPS